ncbi:MAG: glycerol-3-phosphate dehydrogenase/oxidase [Bacteriovoracaceae bacterium]|nr:glycerol-3-phosphate dehydrogenase/oxidase [Bacteriovoracaceae bacterium]
MSIPKINQIDDHYDVVIVGAGIVGAGIFRDLSLHGLKCLLIDKKDFGSQTSQSSSKMLHGGIRYLENFDFGLIWEALHEKNLWLKLAPHLCYEDAFYLPVFKESAKPLWMLKIGLFIYDLLSGFQNTAHRLLGKKATKLEIPSIKEDGLKGAGIYYDAIMDDVKLTLEVIYDGLQEAHAQALNYVELERFTNKDTINDLQLKDCITGTRRTITCLQTVMALGPFADNFLMSQPNIPWSPKLYPSKGSHLWINKSVIDIKHPMVLNTIDGRVIFVIPRNNAILVGTTELETKEDFFDMSPSKFEIQYLLDSLNEYFPNKNINHTHILSNFSGIRPLVQDENSRGESLKRTSRVHHNYQPFSNLHIILGGKYTTFRVMGQEISRTIVQSFNKVFNSSLTKRPLRQRSIVLPFDNLKKDLTSMDLENIIQKEHVRTLEDLKIRRLGLRNSGHWNFSSSFEELYSNVSEEIKSNLIEAEFK